MRLDILGMQAFLSIAEHGSFQRAAIALNISQTALSHRIRKFEESVGVELLSRTTRTVSLTEAGISFLPKVREALEHCSACLRDLRSHGLRGSESIAFGCLPSLAMQLLPKSLGTFTVANPLVTLRVFDLVAPKIMEMVASGAIEFGLTFVSAAGPGLRAQPIRRSRYAAICPKAHPLATKKSVSAEDLATLPLIRLGQGDVGHLMLEDALHIKHGSLRWLYEVQQARTAICLVGEGHGIAILPAFAVGLGRDEDVVAVPLDHPRLSITVGILSRQRAPLSLLATKLVDHLRRTVEAQSGWDG
jgi:DNA-binding transcriptional LysR family regulator